MRIAVLGGSTPFSVPLVDAIAALVEPPGALVLHGRDRRALDAVANYAEMRLAPQGWRVSGTTVLEAALEGAVVVLHQIRYGDLAGRADDERLAERLGVPADETLGPAALRAALRAAPPLRDLAERLRAAAPDALVVNLTNPLSVTTAVLANAGVWVWGLCELPLVTVDSVAAILGYDGDGVEWGYTGLNHRGFLHDLHRAGQDMLPFLVAALSDRSRLGVTGDEIAALGAVPLKYFSLFSGHAPHGSGRAAQLERLRADAISELERDPTRRPPSLAGREMPWYARSVAPVIAAAVSGAAVDTVVNIADEDGIVRERRARVAGSECLLVEVPAPPGAVVSWLDRFLAHERAVLGAVDDPSSETLVAACEADPLLPDHAVTEAARLLIAAA
jgi:6-phospho-beta-glucosidase